MPDRVRRSFSEVAKVGYKLQACAAGACGSGVARKPRSGCWMVEENLNAEKNKKNIAIFTPTHI
jgi:hypothetical protein